MLCFIELSSRRVHMPGSTPKPDAAFMTQVTREATGLDGTLDGKKILTHDGDKIFTEHFREMPELAGSLLLERS